ncbi:type III secretion protein [Loktanella sp. IMCC34160]|uniref:flagellar biosynthetic protein FliR n=1 Tax=Loktanella sp. IMCC34160 TaxID=2510646 RepID=UPI00101D3799|nr:flagellar biosynthetic protein FliR [Loktanella sp. IMCC34160]RYG91465.1 type III secretion protein [Loktanella sp. IMCC34160]
MEELAALLPYGQAILSGWFLVFIRIGAMMALLPAFGEQSVPVRVKLGLALAFSLVVAPAVLSSAPAPIGFLQMIGSGGAETVAGLFLGIVLRLMIVALQIAGTIAAQSTSLSQLFGGSAGTDPQPAMGHLLVIGGLALAAILGLHVKVAAFMIGSYQLIPIGQVISPQVVAEAGLARITSCFALGFTLAAPFVIASLIYNVTLGVINRAMPQLMVAFVGAPAITAGGLLLLTISAPIILSIWSGAFDAVLADPFGGGG